MITWETKVNGILILHTTATRKQLCSNGKDFLYNYEYYEIGQGKVICGHVSHEPCDGCFELLKLIMSSVKRKQKDERKNCGNNAQFVLH
jgi:hypothetical protein